MGGEGICGIQHDQIYRQKDGVPVKYHLDLLLADNFFDKVN